MAKESFPMPIWTLKIGQELVKIDAIQRWYLYHLNGKPGPYEFYQTYGKHIDKLITMKLARFVPGRYPSNAKRIVEITNAGKSALLALERNDAAKREKILANR